MAIKILDWNVNGFALSNQAQLLDDLEWDVALLQEVTRRSTASASCATFHPRNEPPSPRWSLAGGERVRVVGQRRPAPVGARRARAARSFDSQHGCRRGLGLCSLEFDRNAPKWERLELQDDEWWNDREPVMYGPDREHDLRDAYRVTDGGACGRASRRPAGRHASTPRR
jgi:hypothetical protein